MSIDPLTVLSDLDDHAKELDHLSKRLTKIERDLEPVEQQHETFLASFEAGLWERHLEGEKFPAEKLRLRMAHQAMPVEILGAYVRLMAERRQVVQRVATLKAVVDAKRSVLSALKAELDAAR